MRQLLLDEIAPPDAARLTEWLKANAEMSPMEGLYWMEMPPDRLTAEQAAAEGDQPFCFAIEVGEDWAKIELLVRSRTNLRSPHTGYAAGGQRAYILDFADRLVADLGLTT